MRYLNQISVDLLKKSTHFILTFVFLIPGGIIAQESWSLSGSVQMTSGKYIYDERINTYFFYAGLSYKSEEWGISATIPFIVQNNNMTTYSGDMFIPAGHSNNENMQNNAHNSSMMDSDNSSSDMLTGLGDLYLVADYAILKNHKIFPEMYIMGQIKIPTSGTNQNFGTGEFDFGAGIILRKQFGTYSAFLDVGYLRLGNPNDLKYNSPIVSGIGFGKILGNGNNSISVYFNNYSRIISEFEGQKQISFGFYHRLNPTQLISISISRGLSETSPDYSISGGIEISM